MQKRQCATIEGSVGAEYQSRSYSENTNNPQKVMDTACQACINTQSATHFNTYIEDNANKYIWFLD